MTINKEKIIKNNYYSKIKINFDKNLLIKYFIDNKINYIDLLPSKFLIIIYEENLINSNLLLQIIIYIKFLLKEENIFIKNYFQFQI